MTDTVSAAVLADFLDDLYTIDRSILAVLCPRRDHRTVRQNDRTVRNHYAKARHGRYGT